MRLRSFAFCFFFFFLFLFSSSESTFNQYSSRLGVPLMRVRLQWMAYVLVHRKEPEGVSFPQVHAVLSMRL